MPRPSRPWFRFYVEALHDPKLRELPPVQRWVWVAVLGAARQSCISGVLLVSENRALSDVGLADLAAVPVKDVRKALAAFESDGMIHRHEPTGAWAVTNWAGRQFESDDVTERTRKHRSREPDGNVPKSFPGTFRSHAGARDALATESETETELVVAHSGNSRGPVDNSDAAGLIEQALDLAATRYGEQRVANGNGDNASGLAKWWTQENAVGARARANDLLGDHDLTVTQLADALLSPNPPWLRHYRRPPKATSR